MTTDTPVLLGGYAAKRCPVRAQNDALPLVRTKEVPSAEDQARIEAGIAFEAAVFGQLAELNPGAVLVDGSLRRKAAVAATLEAMKAGAPLVLGGWLPDDVEGGRTGKPDILVKVSGGYLPADVKHHRSVQAARRTTVLVSGLASPADRREMPGWTAATGYRYGDGMQLSHYFRMLTRCNYAPAEGPARGAIVGSSRLPGPLGRDDLMLVWHDLDAPAGFTFSHSRGKVRRSLLERYDHEHDFRLKVVQTARRIGGRGDDPGLLVRPVGQAECATCPYQKFCADQMADDPSTAITVGRLDRGCPEFRGTSVAAR